MEAITAALPTISKVANIGSGAYNLYNQWQQQQYQNRLRELAMNPAKMAQFAQGFTKPLNAGLTAGVGNATQAYLAQRGLSDSPQITAQVESQAIAPYIQQNEEQGYQNALAALGLGGGAIPPAYQHESMGMDLAKILANLNPGGSGGGDPYQVLYNAQHAPAPDSIQTTPTDLTGFYEPDFTQGLTAQ